MRAPLGMNGSSVMQAARPRGNAGATVISTLPGKPADCCCKNASATARIASGSCWPGSGAGCAAAAVVAAARRFCWATEAAGEAGRVADRRAFGAAPVLFAELTGALGRAATGLPSAPICGGSPRDASVSKLSGAEASTVAAEGAEAFAPAERDMRAAARFATLDGAFAATGWTPAFSRAPLD